MSYEEVLNKLNNLNIIKVESINSNDVIMVCDDIDKLEQVFKLIKPELVLVSEKNVDQTLTFLFDELKEDDEKVDNFLRYAKLQCINEMKKVGADTDEHEKLINLEQNIESLITMDRKEEIGSFQFYIPFNGKFLSYGLIEKNWCIHKDSLNKYLQTYYRA